MFKVLLPLATSLCLAVPAAAQDSRRSDRACPRGERAAEAGPGAICIGRHTRDYSFSVIYPRAVAAIPRLDAWLRDQALRDEVRFEAAIERGQAGARRSGVRPSYEQVWRMDALLPELAALSSTIHANGALRHRTVLFDRPRNQRIGLDELFSVGALEFDFLGQYTVGEGAMQRSFCGALRAKAREQRGDPALRNDCPDVMDQPITLICGANNRIETMRALLARRPRDAMEVPYEVDFPIDALMMAAVRREYRPAFAVPGENRPRRVRQSCR